MCRFDQPLFQTKNSVLKVLDSTQKPLKPHSEDPIITHTRSNTGLRGSQVTCPGLEPSRTRLDIGSELSAWHAAAGYTHEVPVIT